MGEGLSGEPTKLSGQKTKFSKESVKGDTTEISPIFDTASRF